MLTNCKTIIINCTQFDKLFYSQILEVFPIFSWSQEICNERIVYRKNNMRFSLQIPGKKFNPFKSFSKKSVSLSVSVSMFLLYPREIEEYIELANNTYPIIIIVFQSCQTNNTNRYGLYQQKKGKYFLSRCIQHVVPM